MGLAHPYTVAHFARSFVDILCKLHGMPKTIVSDRDIVFISNFWQEFFLLQHTRLQMNSTYHPQTEVQTEQVNQCLETYLRCFVELQPKHWVKWLPWEEWSYNTSYHEATRLTPL